MKMMRIAVLLALVSMCTQMTACAAIFKGPDEDVTINSDPSGADVRINGQPRGQTPLTLSLDSDKSYSIKVQKEGFESGHMQLGNEVGAGWVVLDVVLFWTIVPLVVDAATGAWYELDRDTVYIELEEISGLLMRQMIAPGSGEPA